MRAVIQRVHGATITIAHTQQRSIGRGLVVFLGIVKGDTEKQADFLAQKIYELRIFKDNADKMNLSLGDILGEILVVSNFTLSTDCKKGRRPSFDNAMAPAQAELLYEQLVEKLRGLLGGQNVKTGAFGAYMEVLVNNDGPVTIVIDTEKIGK